MHFFTADQHYGHANIIRFCNRPFASVQEMDDELNGRHILVRGSHDRWLGDATREILELQIEGPFVVVCHYALRTWPRSHHNSWQLHGHSHGQLEPLGKQWDVGVDNNDYCPESFARVREIMAGRPDNPGLVAARRGDRGRFPEGEQA